MSAEQVLRAAIILQMFCFTYDDLAFHINDSDSLRRFCRIGIADKGFKKSALNSNIKRISDETWEKILRVIVAYAEKEGIEKGREVRIDCTVVESNIHPPTDATLLWDCVRVLTRLILFAISTFGININFSDHQRRLLKVSNKYHRLVHPCCFAQQPLVLKALINLLYWII